MAFKPENMKGRLFDSKSRRTSDKQPDYTGSATIDGVLYRMAAWYNPPSDKTPLATYNLKFQKDEDYQREAEERKRFAHGKTPADKGRDPASSPSYQDEQPPPYGDEEIPF